MSGLPEKGAEWPFGIDPDWPSEWSSVGIRQPETVRRHVRVSRASWATRTFLHAMFCVVGGWRLCGVSWMVISPGVRCVTLEWDRPAHPELYARMTFADMLRLAWFYATSRRAKPDIAKG